MTDFNFDQASYGDLLDHAKSLDNTVRILETALSNRDRQLHAVTPTILELIENKTITDEEAITVFVENLDINLTRVVNFTIQVEVTGSLELPYGEELSEHSFDVEELYYDGNRVEIDYSSVGDVEWDFDE